MDTHHSAMTSGLPPRIPLLFQLILIPLAPVNPKDLLHWSSIFSNSCSLHVVKIGEIRDSSEILDLLQPQSVLRIDTYANNLAELETTEPHPLGLRKLTSSDPCFALILLLPNDPGVSYWEDLLSYLQSPDFLQENPNYVLFQHHQQFSASSLEHFSKFLTTLRFIHTTSKYISVREDTKILEIVCLHCLNSQDREPTVIQAGSSRSEIDEAWHGLHRNLNGTLVQLLRRFLLYFNPNIPINCENLLYFVGDPRICFIRLLSSLLGFEVVFDPNRVTKLAGDQYKKVVEDPNALDGIISNEVDNWQATEYVVQNKLINLPP